MPIPPTYPGVYVEEIPSGVRTIVGVPTSITAFVGRAPRGAENEAITVRGFGDYTREFGGLAADSTMSYAVSHFFAHGGGEALIVRVVPTDADYATVLFDNGGTQLTLRARSKGAWGNRLRASVDYNTRVPLQTLFNLYIEEVVVEEGEEKILGTESFLNVSTEANDPRYLERVLENESNFARVKTWVPATNARVRPSETLVFPSIPVTSFPKPKVVPVPFKDGKDGGDLNDASYISAQHDANKTGLYALRNADIFNLLCVPPPIRGGNTSPAIYAAAAKFCRDERAMLLVDPPAEWGKNPNTAVAKAAQERDSLGVAGLDMRNAALYFPRIIVPDPLRDNQLDTMVPCGAVAGVIAATDANRGVWKAPAGTEAGLAIQALELKLTDGENGTLNPLAINCLRRFPVIGHVVWGARTMRGANVLSDEWKYVPVRRLALYLEESLYRSLHWVVFEPNDEPLWAQIRLNVGSFMHDLFRQGAFQGKSSREAYLVKCDRDTTTQSDINAGVVNIVVGFAPLKPAEFVYIKIQQLAGQIQT